MYKEYEVKMKMVQEQLKMAAVKNEVFTYLLHKNLYSVGSELTFGVGEEIVPASWGITPYPPVGKILLIYRIYILYIIYAYKDEIKLTHLS